MSGSVAGRTALVTGGAQGIGAAVARRLAREGAHIVLLDQDHQAAHRTCESITRAGSLATVLPCDLGDRAQVEAALDLVEQDHPPVTLLCLNAGIGSLGTVETLVLDEWHRTMAVNLESNLHLLRRLLGPMREAGGGSIVAVSSLGAASAGHPTSSPAYGVSKAALERLVLDVAQRHADDGIRANCVRPGPVATAFTAHRLPGPGVETTPVRPLPGRVEADDVAEVVVFLLSERSRLVTGQTITADGGFSAPRPDRTTPLERNPR